MALELGGPSEVFAKDSLIPIYPHLTALDLLDFSDQTLWSDHAQPMMPLRRRLIGEAGTLAEVPDEAYDLVLSSHVLEHLANPIGALGEWRRVIRRGGHLLIVAPHRDGTFDHRRPITPLAHLLNDAARGTSEDDMTHLPEILEFHDLDRDPGAPERAAFEQRCRENPDVRAMHHHVFDSRTLVEVCRAADLDVRLIRPRSPCNIVCLCRAGPPDAGSLDERTLSHVLATSPFPSDRRAAANAAP
ncbi:MAG TPA: methyltransferase domain-containing protein [Solirubrobacteraceae bacterium]|nr:methyltransferase domain-containing protein [Solirubrobacteraceae bacterium]